MADHNSPPLEANPIEKNNDSDQELKLLPKPLSSVTMCYIVYYVHGIGTEPGMGPNNHRHKGQFQSLPYRTGEMAPLVGLSFVVRCEGLGLIHRTYILKCRHGGLQTKRCILGTHWTASLPT